MPQVQPIPYQTVREGNPVQLFCLARGNPEPTAGDYTWTDNKGNNHQTQNLTIGSVTKNHTGEYRCTVNVNSKGGYGTLTASTRTRITVQCKYYTGVYTISVNVSSKAGNGTLTGSTATRVTVQCKY